MSALPPRLTPRRPLAAAAHGWPCWRARRAPISKPRWTRALRRRASCPTYDWLRPPDIGLAMVRGRIGGTGDAFNLGEATVTRATLRLRAPGDGSRGRRRRRAIMGRDRRRAEARRARRRAPANARASRGVLQTQLIEPLAAQHAANRARSGNRTPRPRASNSSRWSGANDGKLDMTALSTLTPGFDDPVHDTQARVPHAARCAVAAGHDRRDRERAARQSAMRDASPARAARRVRRAARAVRLRDARVARATRHARSAFGAALSYRRAARRRTAAQAAFAYIHDAGAMPPLESFALGDGGIARAIGHAADPRDVADGRRAARADAAPASSTPRTIAPVGLPEHFWRERAALAPLFPCGIDCYLVCGARLIGLPRTTQVKVN